MTPSADDIRRAAALLESGRLVAFPTETVYGLGADAEDPAAVAQIYAAKGRPSTHPLIVHLAPEADLGQWAREVPEAAKKLIAAFWPGPLTLIMKKSLQVPDAATGGQDTIGLRCPSHPVAQALLRAFKQGRGGVAAPSANRFGHVSPTTAQHVKDEFRDDIGDSGRIGMVLDGGQSQVGIESTIIDLSRWETHGPVLLRPGHIGADAIAAVLGVEPRLPDAAAPRASGTLEAHYAPLAPVALVSSGELVATVAQLHAVRKRVVLLCHTPHSLPTGIAQISLPSTPEGYAHGLYAALRVLDGERADLILVEAPPAAAAWQGVNDRLRRAAHDSSGVIERLLDGD
ncbi:MAG: threonylcarbamoyl-AMP synthase [Burkholderiaceae bacterium]|nr:threonylcarbamoyl-AMP synthase [Burkholderiaceae bacterium]